MDIVAFEKMMRDFEASLEGESLIPYEPRDLNTKIVGNIAYTSWSSDDWLESAVFVREGDRWLLDRADVIPIEAADE